MRSEMRRQHAWLQSVTSTVIAKPDPSVTAFTLDALGTQAQSRGDHQEASALFLEAALTAIRQCVATEWIRKAIGQAERVTGESRQG